MSSNVTIQSFALEMQISVDRLIKKFLNIGIIKTKFDFVTQKEKEILFENIGCDDSLSMHKFSLLRQTHSTLNICSIGGKNKQVQIEIRKKQVYLVPHAKKKSDIDSVPENTLKPENQSKDNCESNKKIINYSLEKSDVNNIKHNTTSAYSSKKNTHESIISNVDHKLNIKNSYKIHNKLQKNINKKQQFSKIKDINSYSDTKLSINYTNKKSIIQSDCSLNVFTLEKDHSNPNNCKLDQEKKYNPRIRSRYKLSTKSFKHKKNNNRYLYTNIIDESDTEEKQYASRRLYKNKRKKSTLIQSFNKPTKIVPRNIIIGETISVLELSNKMSIKSSHMIKLMMQLGLVATINQMLDQETAQLISEEMGHNVILRKVNELEELIMNNNYNKNHVNSVIANKNNDITYQSRDPIVTIMGHVDHGKTSLLDCIRSTKIAQSESGNITQNIGAYRVFIKNRGSITFLDTPGHEAFINMRIRGANLTDIVVLVIAADDGIMPQTIESIEHIKSINIPIIVAINKIDKSDINIDQIKHELNKYEIIPEEWGGNTQFINISAISGKGVPELLEAILLQSEILELKAIHDGMAKAIVIESSLDKGKGPIITVLIKEGKLKCGDIILCGTEYGRVRAMRDEHGSDINFAGPSMPVEILGLSGVPNAGDIMIVVLNEKKAREVALYRKNKLRTIKLSKKQDESITKNVFSNLTNITKVIELNFIIKSDTQGSMEAICNSLIKFSTNEVAIKILLASIGNITETDSVLASTSHALILGFNVKADTAARRVIELNNLNVRYYSVIYDLLDDVQKIIYKHKISTVISEPTIIGSAKVHDIFHSPKYGTIAGCVVIEGIIKPRKKIMIFRNNIVVHKGELESLRHFKNDVSEVKNGMECGIGIKNFNDIRSGDIIKVLDILLISN